MFSKTARSSAGIVAEAFGPTKPKTANINGSSVPDGKRRVLITSLALRQRPGGNSRMAAPSRQTHAARRVCPGRGQVPRHARPAMHAKPVTSGRVFPLAWHLGAD